MSPRDFPFLFLRFFLPISLLLVAGMVFYGRAEIAREESALRNRETLNVGLGAGALAYRLDAVIRDLRFVAGHSALRHAVDAPTPENLAQLAEDFANLSGSKALYDQIRWLDENGRERVRVDYRKEHPLIVPHERLQDKSGRYYFADTFRLAPGEIFISPLDLNIEQNRIEIPYKPMIRIGTPITDSNGTKRGIVLLNYYAKELLDAFATASANIADHIAVVNRDGYWLRSPDPAVEWGFMLEQPESTLARQSPDAWKRMQAAESGQMSDSEGLWTWQTVFPLELGPQPADQALAILLGGDGETARRGYFWKVVAHLPNNALAERQNAITLRLTALGTLLLALLAFGSWRLAKAWAAQAAAEAEVRRVNAGLEQVVAERTLALKEKIAALDEANAELGRKNEEMEGMIYAASHDLRSPLVNIQGFSQRLEKAAAEIGRRLAEPDVPPALRDALAKPLNERIPSSLDFIKASSRKMDALVNALLRLSRAGRVTLSLQPLDMDAMLRDIVASLTIQLQGAEGSITVEPLPGCLGDSSQINQVFSNLLDNALKYGHPQRPPTILIAGYRRGERAIYEVADNGIGIAPEFQAKAWELFHRLNPNGPVPGEGIGLPLVRRIIARHHGRISLESAAGEGCRFIIDLPAAPAPGEPTP